MRDLMFRRSLVSTLCIGALILTCCEGAAALVHTTLKNKEKTEKVKEKPTEWEKKKSIPQKKCGCKNCGCINPVLTQKQKTR